ncbi:hypothetical protein IT084_05270 [Desulfallas sp. Bu1-1]|uniref:hypothetical protein n=1 Tax=Desulfallas sp. Bu1-1 TaxID=2787620 RepID=UPI00189FE1EA|nr:hypothetical protein [Desulfallas sp. Bu1-1]MBF7082389.1 hypothetical protein [Desulfallas sp. Bu1-1]
MVPENINDREFKINYNLVGRKYCVVTEHSGVPAADFFHGFAKKAGNLIVPQEKDSSADIR